MKSIAVLVYVKGEIMAGKGWETYSSDYKVDIRGNVDGH